MNGHIIEFRPSGRGKAQCPPDQKYPNGKALDFELDAPSCLVALPYPAPECGAWLIRCEECHMTVAVTAAGRPDDPISIRIPCRGSADV